MRRYIKIISENLVEAPISDIHHMGDSDPQDTFDNGTGFGNTDRKLLRPPKALDKIMRAFQRTPFTFEVFFINSQIIDGDSKSDNELIDDRAEEMKVGIYGEFGPVTGRSGVIRVVQLANLSPLENKMPMTGWTLAHKIGHSIQDHVQNTGWKDQYATPVNAIVELLWQILSWESQHRVAGRTRRDDFGTPTTIVDKLTMESARDGRLDNPFEIFAEIVAQYLVTGRVTMKLTNPTALDLVEDLNDKIGELFTMLKGKVLVEI